MGRSTVLHMSDSVAVPWNGFVAAAPTISTVFRRRHAATGNLVMLATLRSDGWPRISPVEPRVFEDRLWIVGMPETTKFKDLGRDPRFCLHTATVDTQVSDGDAKLFGRVVHVADPGLHQRFAEMIFDDIGLDLRGQTFGQFFEAEITGASSVAIVHDENTGDRMEVTIWTPGLQEHVVVKH